MSSAAVVIGALRVKTPWTWNVTVTSKVAMNGVMGVGGYNSWAKNDNVKDRSAK